MGRLGVNWLI